MMFSVKGKRADAVRKRSLFDAEKYETMVQMNGKNDRNGKGFPVAKSRNRKFAVFLLVLVVFMVGFVLLASSPSDANYLISNVSKGKSQKAYMEVADSDFARMRGLMFRDRIIPILFIFDSPGKFAIHSNFVKSEFDAVYISQDGKIVEIFRKIPPSTQLVSPKKTALYLLELPPELFDKLHLAVGDEVAWKELKGKA